MAAIDIWRARMLKNLGKLGTYELHVDEKRRIRGGTPMCSVEVLIRSFIDRFKCIFLNGSFLEKRVPPSRKGHLHDELTPLKTSSFLSVPFG